MDKLKFYLEQLVAVEDLNNLQDNVEAMFSHIIQDLGMEYAYNGMLPVPLATPAMGITVGAGRCYFGSSTNTGQFGSLPSDTVVDLAHDYATTATAVAGVGAQKWVSVFAIPRVINDTPVLTPAGSISNYHTWGGVTLNVRQGTEAAIATRPDLSVEPTGILICDILLTYGQSIVTALNIDQTRVPSYDADGHRVDTIPYLVTAINTVTATDIPAIYQALTVAQTTLAASITSQVGDETTRAEGVEAGKAALVHTHDAAAVISGVFDKARIPPLPADITQIEALIMSLIGTPAGTISGYAGDAIPAGWLFCDGSSVSRSTYANLFAAIKTIWGGGDGSTTFNIPNLQSRFLLGRGNRGIGDSGGEETHTLSNAEMPQHNHSLDGGSSNIRSSSSASDGRMDYGSPEGGGTNGLVDLSIGYSGGNAAHNNMPPFVVLDFIIKT